MEGRKLMKLEKPKVRHTEPQPWQEREDRPSEEETSRMRKRAEELDALNQTLEQLRS